MPGETELGGTSPPQPLDAGASADASASQARPSAPHLGPPSCRGETELCGPESDSCCLSLPVAGGAFALPLHGKQAQVTVSAFRLDKYEVTVGRFRAFLADYDEWYHSGAPLPEPDDVPRGAGPSLGGGFRGDAGTPVIEPLPGDAVEFERRVRECGTIPLSTLDLPNSSSRIPLNCITWVEAAAFCAWDGGRLPTLAESYHAAAGGAEGRLYPWGNEPTPSRLYAAYGCTLGVERPECAAASVLPVGSHPSGAGLFGHVDLAGSMSEWLLDGSLDAYVDGCVDCAGPPLPGYRFWRGGSWIDSPVTLQNSQYVFAEQKLRLQFLGLRCARDAEP